MTDHIDINLLNWEERAAIHAQDTTGGYMLGRFRAGEDSLHAIEAAELGDISGKRVLQCHIGRDTLCLARRGATVTGLDFSKTALDVARRLSKETGRVRAGTGGRALLCRCPSSIQCVGGLQWKTSADIRFPDAC